MKKRLFALLLCAAVLTALLPCMSGAATDGLNFVSINDTLPPELINTVIYSGGRIYVPYWFFTNYGFGITYVYFSSASTVYLYSGDRQLFFELSTGKTYDGDDWHYTTSALVQNGTVYLPLDFMCTFFGSFRYSTMAGNEYGSILRITTGAEVLTDAEFLQAAKNAMRVYYQNYQQNTEGPASPTWTPGQPAHVGDRVRLALLGLPADWILEQMEEMKLQAGFFLTAAEIRSDPDRVRRLACAGYGLGICCVTGTVAEYQETAALLWEVTRTRVTLTWLPPEVPAPDGAARLVWDAGYDRETAPENTIYELTAVMETGGDDMAVIFPCDGSADAALEMLLYYLQSNGFTVTAPRITDSAAA